MPEEELRRAVALARRLRRQEKMDETDQENDVFDRCGFMTASAGAGIAVIQPSSVLSSGRRIGADIPKQLSHRTARLRRLDDFVGGGDTYQMYVRELKDTTRLANEGVYSQATGRGLRAIIAEQAQLAGWAAYDAGNYEGARGHYMTALAASRAAEDTALEGNSLAFLAYLEWTVGGGTAAYEVRGARTQLLAEGAQPAAIVPGVTRHGEDIGRWLASQRRGWDQLNEEQQHRLTTLGVKKTPRTRQAAAKTTTASRPRTGGEAFQKGLHALQQYTAREGWGGLPGRAGVQEMPDGDIHRVGVGLANQKQRRDRLHKPGSPHSPTSASTGTGLGVGRLFQNSGTAAPARDRPPGGGGRSGGAALGYRRSTSDTDRKNSPVMPPF
ncbi:helicase associated domain-containing protein [Streptomyces sp. NPDC090036]|uniref:helicase associated domain-containing protein n=1 Tax=Streptomyces sp. NPDC090036 TaxID=3365926 RepID=UPI0038225B3A